MGETEAQLESQTRLHSRSFSNFWGGPCSAHVFEGFFGLEDEPVKSVKIGRNKVRDTLEAPMSLPCAAYNFGLLSGSLLCFIVWNPIPKKTLNPTNVRFRLKARGLLLS